MKNITSLASLYKRDTKGKVRIWTIEWGSNSDMMLALGLLLVY